VLHLDERGDPAQRAGLERVFLGSAGGDRVSALPWVRKARNVIDVRVSPIAIQSAGDGRSVRIGRAVRLRATTPVQTEQMVACVIPGYDRVGRELYADKLLVDDGPFAWELAGNSAFASDFEYASSG